MSESYTHPTAVVESGAGIGGGTFVWHGAHIRAGASIGSDCIIGRGVFIDSGVRVGNRCKIQNEALVYRPAVIEDGVFIGPGAILTNDRYPRAINPDGSLKTGEDWNAEATVIEEGATIGAGAVVLPGVRVGRWSVVGALALVSRSVVPHDLIVGIPGRAVGQVCYCGKRCQDACELCGWHAAT
jgi:UDP-2-acetamido-3-amino-2,3-dideoxy-glucuronate N-acetyltransferase